LASLQDRRTGQAWLKPGVRSAFIAGLVDGQALESRGQWLLPTITNDLPSVTAREDGFIGSIPYTFELTFYADSPRIDVRVKVHLAGQKLGRLSTNQRDDASAFIHEEKLRFKVFPATDAHTIGVRDLPFAIAETTNRYVEGNYWTALADGQNGLAVFNRGTMGSVRESDSGFSMPLAYAMYYIWGTRMLDGDFTYEFAFYPFTGDWHAQDIHRRALEYNFPVVSVSTLPGTGALGAELRLLQAGSDNVLLSALYPENGRVLARLYEYQGRPGSALVALGGAALQAVDLLGRDPHPVANPMNFKPWQIQTLQFGAGH
jgi:alpha-mannosidase